MLAAVGALAIAGGAISLFSGLGRRPVDFRATEAPPVDSPDFILSISGTVNGPLRHGGGARLLNNGIQIVPAFLEAIRSARQSVNFTAYIWEDGEMSGLILDAMLERQRAGVPVRILLDELGGARAPAERMKELRAAGGQVSTFRPLRFGKLVRFHKRNHRRAIVIDGVLGFTGGAAVADKWLGDADSPEHWRDTMVEVTGPMAASLQSAFSQAWAYASGEILAGPRFYPLADQSAPPGEARVVLHTSVDSAPSGENHPLRLFFMQSFLAARRTLYITTPYFVPAGGMREAVARRARAGVDVRILLPDEHTDAWPIRLTSHHYYEDLLEAGVRIYEYQPTMMHSKHVVVDGLWSVVGSANMDIRSFELNHDNVLGILDPGFGREMEETFLLDLKRAREIRLPEWRERGAWARMKERTAALFAEQY